MNPGTDNTTALASTVKRKALRSFVAWSAQAMLAVLIVLLVTGCHHHVQQAYQPPPPATRTYARAAPRSSSIAPQPQRSLPNEAVGKTTLVETGMASWYSQGTRAADGSAFDKNAMTAAHKTLPMGTTVRVTNLANGESVIVRITDRGPFSGGRVLDLSEGAAKQIDLYRMGVAQVKIEAFAHPTADPVGKWVVQTGAFKTEQDALDLKAALIRRYTGSKVTEFPSATGYWVRIDPPGYNRQQATVILDWIGKPDDHAQGFLVRIN
jgi:rare lipoprotein A